MHEKLILTQWDHCPRSVPMWPYKSKWPLIRRGCGHRSNVPGRRKNHNLWFNPQTQRPDAYLQRPVLCKDFLSLVSSFFFPVNSARWCIFLYSFNIALWASRVIQAVKTLPAVQETWIRSLSWEDPLEKGMVTHSSILAWRMPWTEVEFGVGVTNSRHDWVMNTFTLLL